MIDVNHRRVQGGSFRIYWGICIRITCTVHRTVISVEHFAIARAGFFVLLASFAVQRKE